MDHDDMMSMDDDMSGEAPAPAGAGTRNCVVMGQAVGEIATSCCDEINAGAMGVISGGLVDDMASEVICEPTCQGVADAVFFDASAIGITVNGNLASACSSGGGSWDDFASSTEAPTTGAPMNPCEADPSSCTDCSVMGNAVGVIPSTCCSDIQSGAVSVITGADKPAAAAGLASETLCEPVCQSITVAVLQGAGSVMGITGVIVPFEDACAAGFGGDGMEPTDAPAGNPCEMDPMSCTDCSVMGNAVGVIPSTCCSSIQAGAVGVITSPDKPAAAAGLASDTMCEPMCRTITVAVLEGAGSVMGITGVNEPFESA